MARAFLLGISIVHARGVSLHQWGANGVFKVVGPFSRLQGGLGGQLGLDLPCLPLLLLGYTQLRDLASTSGALKAP